MPGVAIGVAMLTVRAGAAGGAEAVGPDRASAGRCAGGVCGESPPAQSLVDSMLMGVRASQADL